MSGGGCSQPPSLAAVPAYATCTAEPVLAARGLKFCCLPGNSDDEHKCTLPTDAVNYIVNCQPARCQEKFLAASAKSNLNRHSTPCTDGNRPALHHDCARESRVSHQMVSFLLWGFRGSWNGDRNRIAFNISLLPHRQILAPGGGLKEIGI